MNIPQPDLIICTPCGERKKRPATKRRHVVDPMTGQEHDLDTCDLHDAQLTKFLGLALLNGHRRFAKAKAGATNGTRIAVATGIAVAKLGAKRGRPRGAGIVMGANGRLKKYATPEEAHEAKKKQDRDRYRVVAAAANAAKPVHSEASRVKDAARRKGTYVPLPPNIHKQRDGSFIELAPPFKCATCGETFTLFRWVVRHCNAMKHKMPGKIINAEQTKVLRVQRSGGTSAPKK